MTREKFIEKIKELDRILMEEVKEEEVVEHTKKDCHYGFETIIDLLEEFY